MRSLLLVASIAITGSTAAASDCQTCEQTPQVIVQNPPPAVVLQTPAPPVVAYTYPYPLTVTTGWRWGVLGRRLVPTVTVDPGPIVVDPPPRRLIFPRRVLRAPLWVY